MDFPCALALRRPAMERKNLEPIRQPKLTDQAIEERLTGRREEISPVESAYYSWPVYGLEMLMYTGVCTPKSFGFPSFRRIRCQLSLSDYLLDLDGKSFGRLRFGHNDDPKPEADGCRWAMAATSSTEVGRLTGYGQPTGQMQIIDS